jgi:hypothetical protein
MELEGETVTPGRAEVFEGEAAEAAAVLFGFEAAPDGGGGRTRTAHLMAARYFDWIRDLGSAYNHRLRLVKSVRQRGINPTAGLFLTSTLTSQGPKPRD